MLEVFQVLHLAILAAKMPIFKKLKRRRILIICWHSCLWKKISIEEVVMALNGWMACLCYVNEGTLHIFVSCDWSLPYNKCKNCEGLFCLNELYEFQLWLRSSVKEYLTISPWSEAEWVIKPVALEGEGYNCFSITQVVGQKKGNIKVSKCNIYVGIKRKKPAWISLLDDDS